MELPSRGSESSVAVIEGLVVAMEDKLKQVDDVVKMCQRRSSLLQDEADMREAQRCASGGSCGRRGLVRLSRRRV